MSGLQGQGLRLGGWKIEDGGGRRGRRGMGNDGNWLSELVGRAVGRHMCSDPQGPGGSGGHHRGLSPV